MYGQNNWQPYGGISHNAVSPAFAMVDGAVVKAHSDLLATGESISAWSVANSALLMLNAVSFESLGFNMQSIPSLNHLMLTEVKVNSLIHCFAGVQNITSVRDLEMAICEREGVTSFEELGLGPISKHPLVLQYFSSQIATASQTSTAAQMPWLWPDRVAPHEGKQGSKIKLSNIKYCTKFAIHRTPSLWMVGIKFKPEFQSLVFETGFIDDNALDGHTWRFIQIWRDPCEKEEDVVGAFGKMLDFYHGQMKPKKKNKALNKMINCYPHVGLLNIASIKFGLWDRMSSSQANTFAADVNPEVAPAYKNTLVSNKHVLEGSVGICLENVLKYVKAYFVSSNYFPDNVTSYPRKQMIFLREICKLEYSLTQYFWVYDFETLGFGDIFTFLAEHISLLPTTWQKCVIVTEKPEKPNSVKVCMSQHYLLELLSQATNTLRENETLSKLMVSELLRMQFPSSGLTLLEDDITEDLLTAMSKNGDNVNSNVVLFSSTLTDFRAEKGVSDTRVCTNDVVELLLRAPMLVDLTSWSCWDYKFAPSLGPLVGWLLSYVTTKELLCLVTKDGKVLRIDHLATVDSFLCWYQG